MDSTGILYEPKMDDSCIVVPLRSGPWRQQRWEILPMGRASYSVPSYLLYIEKEVAKSENKYEFMSSGKGLGSWLIGQLSERSN